VKPDGDTVTVDLPKHSVTAVELRLG
jgi:hypothetical protein